MPDNEIEAVAETIAETIETGIEEAAAELIEEAVSESDRKVMAAEQLAEAALEGERGRQIREIKEDVAQCQNILNLLPAQLGETLANRLNEFRLEMMALLSSASNAPTPNESAPNPMPEASTPPNSPIQPEAIPNPEPAPEPAPEVAPLAPKRKHRFL